MQNHGTGTLLGKRQPVCVARAVDARGETIEIRVQALGVLQRGPQITRVSQAKPAREGPYLERRRLRSLRIARNRGLSRSKISRAAHFRHNRARDRLDLALDLGDGGLPGSSPRQ